MKIARVFVQEYSGRTIGDIHDVFSSENHPGVVLSGTLKEVEVADDFDKDVMNAVIAEDGSVTFEISEAKQEAKLNGSREIKLANIRSVRSSKLGEVDIMVNDVALADTSLTQAQVKDYRQELKDATNPYKDYASDVDQAAALDALDVAAFVWPTKPS